MRHRIAILVSFWLGGLLPTAAQADDPFAAHIRPTDPLSPEEERERFTLPSGFEIQLVASEPEILKPMNMAFDAKGRLWITESTEYPFPSPPSRKGRDSIKILEDTDGDGRADKVTTFAEGLNIPIGLYPYRDGAIVFSIPNIWFLRDTDGDGKADERKKLYGPFGHERDTHGLNNSFRRGFDGWLYACHGFNNVTEVSGADGHTIRMHSGNTYRIRLDGSRIEHYTHGQVNPFGMTMDSLFNLFTADCHSKPINRLLRGGYHPSFGKPHDGLGFIPPMMQHTHGSTAIAGLAYYAAENFPEEYRGNMFSGNVMTSRVNRNSLTFHGATIRAKKEPDFVVSGDPWFRPVDLRLGPDGALYIADFYNRIIGHYEVPLDHPGRDRHRGRIWRVVYTPPSSPPSKGGETGEVTSPKAPDLSRADVKEVIGALDHENLTVRRLAMHQLVDRCGAKAVAEVRQAWKRSGSPRVRSHGLWVLHRLGGVSDDILDTAADDPHRSVRVHAMKVLSEIPEWSARHGELALRGLQDEDPFVQLAAADALGQHPRAGHIRPLLDLLKRVPEADGHLRHTVRMALRNQLRRPEHFVTIPYAELNTAEAQAVAGVCLALDSSAAASFLVKHMQQGESVPDTQSVRDTSIEVPRLREFVQHAARYVPREQTAPLVGLVRRRFAENPDFQAELLISVHRGLQQRGSAVPGSVRSWGVELAEQLLDSVDAEPRHWSHHPLPGDGPGENPWGLERRPSADGTEADFLSSRPHGEQLTGVLRSPVFEIPKELRFFLAGHNGPPGSTSGSNGPASEPRNVPTQSVGSRGRPVESPRNVVRLREAGTNPRAGGPGRILAEAPPPGHDVAQPIKWDLSPHAGERGHLEIVDGREERGYAWLAVGRFEPPVVAVPQISPRRVTQRQQTAARIIARLQLQELKPRLSQLVTPPSPPLDKGGYGVGDAFVRRAAAEALVALNPDARLAALVPLMGDPAISNRLSRDVGRLLTKAEPEGGRKVLIKVMQSVPWRLQVRMAQTLAGDRTGAETLLDLVEQGHASARLLLNSTVGTKLQAVLPDEKQPDIARLAADAAPPKESVNQLIRKRRDGFRSTKASVERGEAVFRKQCAACHQVDGRGSVVGPQLDGIGNRGLERIIEDILDPNRNVDVAFRTTTLVMNDGRVKSGLFRRQDGALLVLVDEQGEEFTVPEENVVQRVRSHTSLMPENVDELLSERAFYDLTAFLLSQTAQSREQDAESRNPE